MRLGAAALAVTFALSLGLALYLTPLLRRGALRFDVLDEPDGRFKRQAAPVPYLGGIAVYLAFLLTLSLVFEFRSQLLGLLLGATLMTMLGLFDDLRVLPAGIKLVCQLVAAWVAMRSDITIQLVSIPAALAWPLSIVWLVGITNAVNILDVSDGVCAGTSAISAAALAAIALLNGDHVIGAAMLALAGGLIGFLRYNWPPARIYLGDAGSLFVGFMLGAVALLGNYTLHHMWGGLAPLSILMVPLLDIVLVCAARLRRGQSPFAASDDHLALRLRRRGWSVARIATLSYGLAFLGGGLGIAIVLAPASAALPLCGLAALLFVGALVWLWRVV